MGVTLFWNVLGVVQLLQQSRICEGNPDKKYIEPIKHHNGVLRSSDSEVKGILKDDSGLYAVRTYTYIKIIEKEKHALDTYIYTLYMRCFG